MLGVLHKVPRRVTRIDPLLRRWSFACVLNLLVGGRATLAFVCSQELRCTLVGALLVLISRFVLDGELECVVVTRETRIDFRSERIGSQKQLDGIIDAEFSRRWVYSSVFCFHRLWCTKRNSLRGTNRFTSVANWVQTERRKK